MVVASASVSELEPGGSPSSISAQHISTLQTTSRRNRLEQVIFRLGVRWSSIPSFLGVYTRDDSSETSSDLSGLLRPAHSPDDGGVMTVGGPKCHRTAVLNARSDHKLRRVRSVGCTEPPCSMAVQCPRAGTSGLVSQPHIHLPVSCAPIESHMSFQSFLNVSFDWLHGVIRS